MVSKCEGCGEVGVYFGKLCTDCLRKAHDRYLKGLKGVKIHLRDDEGNEFSKEISVGDTEDVGTILRSQIEVIKIEEIE